jgi:feruloyl esterase
LTLVVNWVEKGIAPAIVPATRRREDGTVMSRPLCAYPATAKWSGTGSTDDAANFVCVDGQHERRDFTVANPPRN